MSYFYWDPSYLSDTLSKVQYNTDLLPAKELDKLSQSDKTASGIDECIAMMNLYASTGKNHCYCQDLTTKDQITLLKAGYNIVDPFESNTKRISW